MHSIMLIMPSLSHGIMLTVSEDALMGEPDHKHRRGEPIKKNISRFISIWVDRASKGEPIRNTTGDTKQSPEQQSRAAGQSSRPEPRPQGAQEAQGIEDSRLLQGRTWFGRSLGAWTCIPVKGATVV